MSLVVIASGKPTSQSCEDKVRSQEEAQGANVIDEPIKQRSGRYEYGVVSPACG